MVTEPRCSICKDAPTRVAVAERRAKGDSLQTIANSLKLTKSSVARHCVHAGLPAGVGPGSGSRNPSQAKRGREGRCATCGTALDDPSPQALVKRAERVLAFGEQIMQKAIDDEDFRLALQAVDRARQSLEQLMKVHGLLQSDGAVTVNLVNAEALTLRKSLSNVVAAIEGERRQAECLALFQAFLRGEEYELPVTIETEVLALPAAADNR